MSYPFTNQQYAQNSNDGYRPDGYGSSSAARIEYDTGAGYHSSYNQHAQHDEMREQNSYSNDNDYAPSPIEKETGNSPYGARAGGIVDPIYSSKSIWTREDKGALGRRSLPVKLLRMLACLIINAIIVIISIICLVVIFARPINVGIGQMTAPSASSVGISGSALTFNGSVDFIVSNPNAISSELSLSAKVYDVVNKDQDIGRGSVSNQKIGANANSTITFPYQVRYDPSGDSSKAILQDLASKCGLTGGQSGQLDLTLKIDANVKILSVPVPVSFSQDVSFTCPISADVLKNIGGGDLLQIIGSSFERRSLAGDHAEL